MGSTKSKWRNQQLAFYDGGTYETVRPVANQYLFDDFLGTTLNADIWTGLDVGAGGGLVAPTGSYVSAAIGALNENGADGIYGDGATGSREWNIDHGWVFEARVRMAVAPINTVEMHIGMIGENYAAGSMCVAEADEINFHALFVLDGAMTPVIYTDDGVADNGPIATGVTAVIGEYNVYKIDATDVTNVLFYIDGVGVGTGTTFSLAGCAADLMFQPWIIIYKAADAGTNGAGTFRCDYVRIWQPERNHV